MPKLKLRWSDAELFLAKLREGYVNMMLDLANTDVAEGGFGPCYVARAGTRV